MTKPVIIKREVKGTPLTYAELDTNFQNLDDATITLKAGTGGTDVVSDLNGTITLVAGSGIVLSGNNTTKTVNINGDVVNDTTPQLGGNLDVNGFAIVSVSNGNIALTPNGTGQIQLNKNIKLANGADFISDSNIGFWAGGTYPGGTPAATNTQIFFIANQFFTGDGFSKAQLTSNGAQNLELNTNSGTNSGTITITAGANGNIIIDPNGTGEIKLDGPLVVAPTTGTPATYENGYYEDMLQTPVAWLKISSGGSDYYLPLFQ